MDSRPNNLNEVPSPMVGAQSPVYVASPMGGSEMMMTVLGDEQHGQREDESLNVLRQQMDNLILQEQQKNLLESTTRLLQQARSPSGTVPGQYANPPNISVVSPDGTQQGIQVSPRSGQDAQFHQTLNMIMSMSPQDAVLSPVGAASPGSMSPVAGQSASEVPYGRLILPQNLINNQVPMSGHIASLAAQKMGNHLEQSNSQNDGLIPQSHSPNFVMQEHRSSSSYAVPESTHGNVSGVYHTASNMSVPLISVRTDSNMGGPSELTRFPTVAEYAEFLTEMRKLKANDPHRYAQVILPSEQDRSTNMNINIKNLERRQYDPDARTSHTAGLGLGEPEADTRTTMMLRNIPNKYTQPMLLKSLDENGFSCRYDFFYLPIDFRNRCNVGYAFINFVTPQDAKLFLKVFHKFKLKAYNSPKVCEVNYARVQGLTANIEVYRNSPVNGIPIQAYRPLIFRNGEVIDFPKPDAPLPPIQLRQTHGE